MKVSVNASINNDVDCRFYDKTCQYILSSNVQLYIFKDIIKKWMENVLFTI